MSKRFCIGGWAFVFAMFFVAGVSAESPGFEQLKTASGLDLFRWSDTCNVYVLRDGDAAMLIDLGDGSVLDHLGKLGIKKVEWVLFTHHHREQCQGHPKLNPWKAQVAVPEKERALFEHPADFCKWKPSLGDQFTVYGSRYARPPVEPLTVNRAFNATDTFTWRGREFWCLDTPGNSSGSMSFATKTERGWLVFSGDVMLAGGRMHNWFDTEWDYGFAAGLYALIGSVGLLESFEPALLLPSHGAVVPQAKTELHAYQQKLRRFAQRYVRGYKISTFDTADQDMVSRPSAVPHLWQTTKHLFKFKEPYWGNFTLLLADSGRALMVDCGCVDAAKLDATLELMQKRLGLKGIDAILVTHMHGDHIVQAPHVREKWGAKIWTLDRIAEQFEHPMRYPYVAPITAYGAGLDTVAIDRSFKPGEKFSWEGYELTVDWMPGQTEFGCCIQGMIDGRRVAFTGDNIFANPADPEQDGHEAVVARNNAILEEGYLYAADYLQKLQPDLIIGGHSFVMDRPKALIERYRNWAVTIRDLYKDLSAEADYRYMFDPYWVRAEPYRVEIVPSGEAETTVCVRNFHDRPQSYRIAIHCPEGITAEPKVLEGQIPAASIARVALRLKAGPQTKPGVQMIALDTTMDARRYGEWFDFVVRVGQPGK